jgi:hypothetical protein
MSLWFCGEPKFSDDVFETLMNPTILAEVLSPSTGALRSRAKVTMVPGATVAFRLPDDRAGRTVGHL